MDKIHEDIKNKILGLEEKINSLEEQKKYGEAQYQALYKMKSSLKEHPELTSTVEEQKKVIEQLKNPNDIDKEIENARKQIEEEWKLYFTTDFIMQPMYLFTKKTYENETNGIVIKGNGKLWLYENSNYATPHTQILSDENGKPTKIIRTVQSSETRGYLCKHIQDIILDQEEPKEEKPKPKKPYPTVKPLKMWKCKCGFSNYIEFLKCQLCNSKKPEENLVIKPKENLAVKKKSKKKKSLLKRLIK